MYDVQAVVTCSQTADSAVLRVTTAIDDRTFVAQSTRAIHEVMAALPEVRKLHQQADEDLRAQRHEDHHGVSVGSFEIGEDKLRQLMQLRKDGPARVTFMSAPRFGEYDPGNENTVTVDDPDYPGFKIRYHADGNEFRETSNTLIRADGTETIS